MFHLASRTLARGLPVIWLALGTAFAQAPATAPNTAGTIVLVDGSATVTPAGGKAHPAKVGDTVNEGDTLASARTGEVHLNMQDSGFVVLRPNTQMKIESYRADGGDQDRGIFNLITGGLRSVSGWIGKFNQKNYAVKTSTATIGIRGTDHETWVIPEGSKDGEPGTYDRVYVGETVIQTAEGETTVAPNQAGFQSKRGKPRLLASIPKFYVPGPHEAEIAAKHAEIQKIIQQRREERRKVIAEKFAQLQGQRAQVKQTMKDNQAASKEDKSAAQQKLRDFHARREALRRDQASYQQAQSEIVAERKAIEEEWKGGSITRKQMRERRAAVNEKAKANTALGEDIKKRKKALDEEGDVMVDERFNAQQERAKTLHDQQLDARGKRESLNQEKESASQELKGLQKEENKRYQEELKKDRASGSGS